MKWISVNERLPEVGQRVIYYFEVVGMHIGKFDGGDSPGSARFSSRLGFLTGDVTHWMPAPFPPEKDTVQ